MRERDHAEFKEYEKYFASVLQKNFSRKKNLKKIEKKMCCSKSIPVETTKIAKKRNLIRKFKFLL